MGWFQEVEHFVNDDVFEALAGFLGEVGVEANAVSTWGAAPPFRFHLLHIESRNLHADDRRPFGDQ